MDICKYLLQRLDECRNHCEIRPNLKIFTNHFPLFTLQRFRWINQSGFYSLKHCGTDKNENNY